MTKDLGSEEVCHVGVEYLNGTLLEETGVCPRPYVVSLPFALI